MAARICILMSILGFTVVHVAAVFRGQDISDIWLTSLISMVLCAVIGFFLGWAFESLIKETLIQEETLMLSEYLKNKPDARGEMSFENLTDQIAEKREQLQIEEENSENNEENDETVEN